MIKTLAVLSDHIPDTWFAAHPVRVIRRPDYAAFTAQPISAGICAQIAYLPALLNRVDGLVVSTCCDQMRRAAEWLGPTERVFLFNLPATATAEKLRVYEEARLQRWLDAQCATACARRVCYAVDLPAVTECQGNVRIGIVGSHFLGNYAQTAAFFRTCGVSLAWWGCEGNACVENVYARPNDAFYQQLQNQIATHQLAGLVVIHTTGCDMWRLAAVRLREVLSIPVATWIVDDGISPFENAQVRTRLEAFCEVVVQRQREQP